MGASISGLFLSFWHHHRRRMRGRSRRERTFVSEWSIVVGIVNISLFTPLMPAPFTENPASIAEVGVSGSEAAYEAYGTARQEEYHRDNYSLKLGANRCQLHILEIVRSKP